MYTFVGYTVCMALRRTTIEIDEHLLARAKRALRLPTTRATVEHALLQAAEQAEGDHAERAERQRRFFDDLPHYVDMDVLASDEMWR